MTAGMRVLIVATKAPWPPVDGGRLLLLRTLEGLAAAGVRPTLVAPVDPRRFAVTQVAAALAEWCEPELVAASPPGLPRTLLRVAARRLPVSLARHLQPAVQRRVEALLAGGRFDLVHAEQLQALPQALVAARRLRLPVVLRAQNVESTLWAAAARGPLLGWEARRLGRWEGGAVGLAGVTLALTAVDAAALRRLALAAGFPEARVIEVPAPFSAELAPGPPDLDGEPPVVMLGSRGWRPNEDAVGWFSGEVWPEVRHAVPGARLHVFGFGDGAAPVALRPSAARGERPLGGDAGSSGISWHSAPAESAVAFARGSVQVVPLRFGSGVRMKILEAWARGVPVVATAEGASGLEASDGAELLVARDGAGFAAALRRLCDEPALAAALVRGGRAALRRRHDPVAVAHRLLAAYAEAAS